jgi:hypothetical protein
MRGDLFFDSRNNFDPDLVEQAGFRYVGIGRGGATTPPAGHRPPQPRPDQVAALDEPRRFHPLQTEK